MENFVCVHFCMCACQNMDQRIPENLPIFNELCKLFQMVSIIIIDMRVLFHTKSIV